MHVQKKKKKKELEERKLISIISKSGIAFRSRRRWRGDRSILVNNRGVARAEIIHRMNYLARLKIRFHAPRLGAPPHRIKFVSLVRTCQPTTTILPSANASLVEKKKNEILFSNIRISSLHIYERGIKR